MEWISVEDRLPENVVDVLISSEDGEVLMGYVLRLSDDEVVWRERGDDYFTEEPTHWMPLPDPPKK